ncbi:adenosylcobinamide-phosphate synthase CbiB [Commensalibacter nepenthis]|uniref:Cobalamin biosynthesis protein CobD n=1 Tax=Commensalibacter nepenthis TaxID=3043872 RepID=A0ABT6Q6T1_9PROT|nr:adenosylcobinamide-phosphate synthase CbiB [Commensalibacter sp. TBRC 10068]MDI2112601.1 adenosylcobinamide-phosphate synthase CbiB [Commensalibacter sp. TBRC 10068]
MKKNFIYCIQIFLLRHLKIMAIAIFIDAVWGDPKSIYNKIPHPIVWIGNLIGFFDKKLNHPHHTPRQQKRNGFITLGLTIATSSIFGFFLQKILFKYLPKPIAYLTSGIIGSIFIARHSLYEHVQNVADALNYPDINIARHTVSQIVGRNTEQLDQSGIARAAIESLAENFSDGVTAPIFWGCIGGLPGIIAYKAINTADSMIGHKTEKYLFFGYAAAKTDDYVNFPASRLSALWIVLAASKNPIADFQYVAKEAKKHNSPNAGWPEAAMANCLSIYLAGPRQYHNDMINTPWIGKGEKKISKSNITNALKIFSLSCNLYYLLILLSVYILNKSKNDKN